MEIAIAPVLILTDPTLHAKPLKTVPFKLENRERDPVQPTTIPSAEELMNPLSPLALKLIRVVKVALAAPPTPLLAKLESAPE